MFVQATIPYDETCVFKTIKDKICLHTIFKTLTNIDDTKDNFSKLYKLKQFIQKNNLSYPVKKDNLNIEIFNDYLKNHNDIILLFVSTEEIQLYYNKTINDDEAEIIKFTNDILYHNNCKKIIMKT
jgi:hypothetical protein